ncbi:hypothetical protein J1N35_035353 [Gossypium stocksii]|uniref:Uncharacterized protein n=1 Tax=Gossypium stocksii TaxID=47602 RepID=A0A9D3UTR7_9ROSI|nr:hypothetical protein J1N35_035353 [Gossypium stocksii]
MQCVNSKIRVVADKDAGSSYTNGLRGIPARGCDERENRHQIMEEAGTNMNVENSNQQAAYEVVSLCSSFGGKDTILYSCESPTVDEVYDSLTLYDKMKHLVVKIDSQGEGLIIRGRQDQNVDDDCEKTQK